ncbi:MAG: DUF1566 domain-containing protein [Campylobacterota bacterium]|nr:DUF1566 domain-containing protein [Campylobacterota bacterium]
MKKIVMSALSMAIGTMVMAGGDIRPSGDYDNTRKSCKDNNVYVDYDRNLMWQDAPYGDAEDGAYKHNRSAGKAGRWRYAKNYCSTLFYGGYDDWRLPTVGEFTDLYSGERIKLKHTIDVDFWTSTPSRGNTYWSVYAIVTGQPYEHKSSDTQYIRCVRCLDE